MIRKYKDNKEYTDENGLNPSFINGYPWLSMVIHGYPWLSMVINGYQWLSMVINGHPLLLNYPLIHLIYFHSFGLLYLLSFRDINSKYLSIMIFGSLPKKRI